jgi:hypothetical protein
MNLSFKYKNNTQNMKLSKITYLLGTNRSGKTTIINNIYNGFINKIPLTVNGVNLEKEIYNIINFSDNTTFTNEFKFTKSNDLKKIIYKDIKNQLDENKILNDVNEIFNTIDNLVNEKLGKELKYIDNIRFDINIDDVDNIIEKYTDIYINDYLLDEKNIPKSVNRRLLYNTLELMLTKEKENIILIDNFDLYLDEEEVINIIRFLTNLTEKYNLHVILATQSNLYSIIENKESVYFVKNENIIQINFIDPLIKSTLSNNDTENYTLLIEEDLLDFRKRNPFLEQNIGKIILYENVELIPTTENRYNSSIVKYLSTEEKEFYEKLKEKIFDKVNDKDI